MVMTRISPSAKVRAKLDHPVIDADGHMAELAPIYLDFLKQVGGAKLAERFSAVHSGEISGGRGLWAWHRMSEQERRENLIMRPTWWSFPMRNTVDRATCSLPKLLYERLDELGIDFAVLYPSMLFSPVRWEDAELRQASCRAYNLYAAEMYRDYRDRLAPAAAIPMHTPQEAIAELEYVVKELGLKVLSIMDVRRPIAKIHKEHPELAGVAFRLDTLAFESDYDYDPFWAKCVELKAVPGCHASAMGMGSRRSHANFMYNHIGAFANANEAMCRSIFMGGVTRRFPTLKVAFLEGGVWWACALLADIVARWVKRNPKVLAEELDPERLDRRQLHRLLVEYGDDRVRDKLPELDSYFHRITTGLPRPTELDDWVACKIERLEDIYNLFVPNFYFGCEADDPMNAWAFSDKVNPFGAKLRAVFSSDISHWDVPKMNEVVAEAYEMVEKGTLTEEDFRDFTFMNPASLFCGTDPDFFKGTVVEKQVQKLLTSNGR